MTDTDRVWIAGTKSRKVYHSDPDCQSCPEDARPVSLQDAAEKMDLPECSYCAGTFETQGSNQYDVFPELHADPDAPTMED